MPVRVVVLLLGFSIALVAAGGCAGRGGRETAKSPAPNAMPTIDVSRGKAIFAQQCAACHGAAGAGGPVGPALTGERKRRSYKSVYAIVLDPAPPMPKLYPSKLTQADLRDVSAYVESL